MHSEIDSGLPFWKDENYNHWHSFSEPRVNTKSWWHYHSDFYDSMQAVKKWYRDLIENYWPVPLLNNK